MIDNFWVTMSNFYNNNILGYLKTLYEYPIKLVTLVVDILIVMFLILKLLEIVRDTRAWQLLKGIVFLVVVTFVSEILNLRILNYILTSFMTYAVIILVVVFQPELRRGLEQLGTSKLTKFFGIDKDLETRTKENIYKIVLACFELSKSRIGGLIVLERDIQIKDISNTGISMDSEISPQLIANVFSPNTPLHDGALIISNNKIDAVACMLPLSSNTNISRKLGTRHRAGLGISEESDAIAIIISEETGKISIAKDGVLIPDVSEQTLKDVLIKNLITKRFTTNDAGIIGRFFNKSKPVSVDTDVIKTEDKEEL